MNKNLWTREEMLLALNLYLKLPFGKMHSHTPEVQNLAKLIGRSDNSVALRLVNFASCDPCLQKRGITGMVGGQTRCQPFWDEFEANSEQLIYESETYLRQRESASHLFVFHDSQPDADIQGETVIRDVKTRMNQNVFRQIVLANYNNQCAISGIDIPDLLLASHIIPWAENKRERLNPANGICLSALYDRAFDKGYIGFTKDYNVIISPMLRKNCNKEYYSLHFAPFDNKQLIMPHRYMPNPLFLDWHLNHIFRQ